MILDFSGIDTSTDTTTSNYSCFISFIASTHDRAMSSMLTLHRTALSKKCFQGIVGCFKGASFDVPGWEDNCILLLIYYIYAHQHLFSAVHVN